MALRKSLTDVARDAEPSFDHPGTPMQAPGYAEQVASYSGSRFVEQLEKPDFIVYREKVKRTSEKDGPYGLGITMEPSQPHIPSGAAVLLGESGSTSAGPPLWRKSFVLHTNAGLRMQHGPGDFEEVIEMDELPRVRDEEQQRDPRQPVRPVSRAADGCEQQSRLLWMRLPLTAKVAIIVGLFLVFTFLAVFSAVALVRYDRRVGRDEFDIGGSMWSDGRGRS